MAIRGSTDRKVFYVPSEMSDAINDYRYGNRIASEAEALRQLIEKGLESEECCRKCNFAAGRDEEGSSIIGGGGEQAGT